jgi:hypothetical protein
MEVTGQQILDSLQAATTRVIEHVQLSLLENNDCWSGASNFRLCYCLFFLPNHQNRESGSTLGGDRRVDSQIFGNFFCEPVNVVKPIPKLCHQLPGWQNSHAQGLR